MIMMMLATTCATVGAGHDAEIAEIAGSTNITVHRWGRGQLFGQPREVAASINEKLLSGEVVKTGERTTARVVFMHSGEQVRLGEFSAIEIAPRDSPCASGLFRLLQGFGFFFRPRDSSEVFFCTPHALGGARGTEFEIRVDEEQGMTVISVQEGRVSVTNALGSAKVHSGQMVVINQTLPPQVFSFAAANTVQWWLQYPAILDLDDLGSNIDIPILAESAAAWRQGDLKRAADSFPWDVADLSGEMRVFRAALLLASGGVSRADLLLAGAGESPVVFGHQAMIAPSGWQSAPKIAARRMQLRASAAHFCSNPVMTSTAPWRRQGPRPRRLRILASPGPGGRSWSSGSGTLARPGGPLPARWP
jgi:hypothetical protein